MDVRTLDYYTRRNITDQEPDLASHLYLLALSFLIRKDESQHIGRNLETHYNWNWDDDITLMSDSFQTEGGSISALTKLTEGLIRLLPRNPKLVDCLTDPCRLVSKIVADASTVDEADMQHQQIIEGIRQKIMRGYEFFRVMSDGLETIIEKYVTSLTPDAAVAHLFGLTSILKNSLHLDDSELHPRLESLRKDNPRLPKKGYPRVISTEWKFNILKKLVTTAQMQLRVVGVTTMCTDLLGLYNQYKGSEASSSPTLVHFANLVLQSQIVDYIVGIASHPEIINESNNILGFLIVTKTYTFDQTDMIWQTVMTSQDPRVVEAILRMIMRCLNLMDYRNLLYLCEKARDVPIEGFTAPMRDFCQLLFKLLADKSSSDGARYVDPPPYTLCVRLIRESSIISADAPPLFHEIQTFAAARLRDLLVHGPSLEARESIYQSCIEDMSAKVPTVPGSICVINALLRQHVGSDMRTLTVDNGLTRLLVEEMEAAAAADRQSSNPSVRSNPASQARRELLLMIILHQPDTINPDLGKRLWDVLVGLHSRTVPERNTSWQILNSAVKKGSTRNAFIATCYRDYLPSLPPHCFTSGALDFVREGIVAWQEEACLDFSEESQSFESPALEQLWNMILTAPQNTIDGAAINILVELYVESALIGKLPKLQAKNIHLSLVDRCLEQLKAAASRLKMFSDGASSGSDEGMVIVASEEQCQEQEKIFARSLAALREFLRAYHATPAFAPAKSKASIADATCDVEGEPLIVKYQSFDGNQQTEVKSLTLGMLNTTASLFASLEKATGFKTYKVYCGGKIIDPEGTELAKSLNELNLNGLILVKRYDEKDGSHNGARQSLELEIMKHFDDLWDYLSMSESVAREVSPQPPDVVNVLRSTYRYY